MIRLLIRIAAGFVAFCLGALARAAANDDSALLIALISPIASALLVYFAFFRWSLTRFALFRATALNPIDSVREKAAEEGKLLVVLGAVVILLAAAAVVRVVEGATPSHFDEVAIPLILLSLPLALVSIVVGRGLRRRASWARRGALLLGFVYFVGGVPLGPFIAAYLWWFAASPCVRPHFDRATVHRSAASRPVVHAVWHPKRGFRRVGAVASCVTILILGAFVGVRLVDQSYGTARQDREATAERHSQIVVSTLRERAREVAADAGNQPKQAAAEVDQRSIYEKILDQQEAGRLARKFSVDPALVERNLDEFRRREAEGQSQYDLVIERAARPGSWLVENPAKAVSPDAAAPDPIVARLGDLMTEYDENELAMTHKYVGRVIQTTAAVQSIGRVDGVAYLTLDVPYNGRRGSATASFLANDERPLRALRRGHTVSLRCRLNLASSGLIGLNNCTIVSSCATPTQPSELR